jgi:hypothetical protein
MDTNLESVGRLPRANGKAGLNVDQEMVGTLEEVVDEAGADVLDVLHVTG